MMWDFFFFLISLIIVYLYIISSEQSSPRCWATSSLISITVGSIVSAYFLPILPFLIALVLNFSRKIFLILMLFPYYFFSSLLYDIAFVLAFFKVNFFEFVYAIDIFIPSALASIAFLFISNRTSRSRTTLD